MSDFSVQSPAEIGQIQVLISNGQTGHTLEDWAEAAAMRIMEIGEQSPPFIRDQALAFREEIRKAILVYMRRAVNAEVNKQLLLRSK